MLMEGKMEAVSVFLFVCLLDFFFFWEGGYFMFLCFSPMHGSNSCFSDATPFSSLCSLFTAATLPPLVHNSRRSKHTWEGRKEREKQSFQYKLSERKNLISNINAGRATLCAIVLLSFQKLVF